MIGSLSYMFQAFL